jgi:hypothetical protein
MTSKQERKLRMYRSVVHYLNLKMEDARNLPYFMETFEKFSSLTELIEKTIQKQIVPRTGITLDKKNRRIILVDEILSNTRKLKLLAVVTDDTRLFNQVNLCKSAIEDQRDLDLKTFAEIIYKEVDAKIELHKEYGISAETQKSFREKIDAFFEMIMKPRTAIAGRSVETGQLADLMGKAYQTLLYIDAAMGTIEKDKPDLYLGYKIARKLVSTRAGKIALRATVKDALSGEPVRGAVLKFTVDGTTVNKDNSRKPIVKESAKLGGIVIHNMAEGPYKVMVNKPGYEEKTETILIVKGERSELLVKLEKAF